MKKLFYLNKLLLFYISNNTIWKSLFLHTLEIMWIVANLIGNKSSLLVVTITRFCCLTRTPSYGCNIMDSHYLVSFGIQCFLYSPLSRLCGWHLTVLKGTVQDSCGYLHMSWTCPLWAHIALSCESPRIQNAAWSMYEYIWCECVSVWVHVCVCALTTTFPSVSFNPFMALLLIRSPFLNPGPGMKVGNYQDGNPYNQLLSPSLTTSVLNVICLLWWYKRRPGPHHILFLFFIFILNSFLWVKFTGNKVHTF